MDEMTASAQVSSADQAVLDDLLAEIAAKIKAGLPVEVQDYAARYPELAGPLQSLLPAIQALGALGQSAEGSLFPHTGEGSRSTTGGCLGDFRILREVGRGGMGIVYETEQISLSRRVALKTLPFAALMDPRHLQRFQNEARTAASLHHPHIVPVYAVGCERGLHYYAMQFIPGQSLAQVIAGLRQSSPGVSPLTPPKPASTVILPKAGAAETVPVQVAVTSFPRPPSDRAYFRQVAEWGIQAAEALEYAHGLGIVHRDIKPANLLLDGQGQVWVTDFGLARVGSDPGLTITGDLVGTLRYMSPEQALAKHGLVDHHTDIYALGATLYELLTLDPAVEGQDRGEILHRIESGDVLAPRHRNRAIPLDLETIVMKAMAPEAGQRYATAQALADDLRHWLEDRPIVARRATAAQRLRRWLWRHRSLVGSVALGALLALVALAGSIGWVVRDWAARRADAEIRLDEALAALGPALEGGDPYDESLRGARRQVEAVLAMGNVGPGPRSEAEDLLNQADILQRLERIRQQRAAVTQSQENFAHAQANQAYSELFRAYGVEPETLNVAEAAERLRPCLIKSSLAAALDDWALSRKSLTTPRPDEVWSYWKDTPPAWWKQQRARYEAQGRDWPKLLELAQALDPGPGGCRARVRQVLARGGTPAQQKKNLEQLNQELSAKDLQPSSLVFLGMALREVGSSLLALSLLREGVKEYPGDFWLNVELANNLSRVVRWDGPSFYAGTVALVGGSVGPRPFLAAPVLLARRAPPASREEVVLHRRVAVALRPDSSAAHFRLALDLEPRQPDEAVAELQRAVNCNPENTNALRALSCSLWERGQKVEAVALDRQALKHISDDPGEIFFFTLDLDRHGLKAESRALERKAVALMKDDPMGHYLLAVSLKDNEEWDEAITEFREAIRLKKDDFDVRNDLGCALLGRGNLEEAALEFKRAIGHDSRDHRGYENLSLVYTRQGKLPEAVEQLRLSVKANPTRVEAQSDVGFWLIKMGQYGEAVKEFQQALKLNPLHPPALNNLANIFINAPDESMRNPAEGLRLAQQTVKLAPQVWVPWTTLGKAYYRNGNPSKAIEALTRAMELKKGGTASDFFFLAMAHHQLGNTTQARQWYDRGVQWLGKKQPKNEEYGRFQKEAEEVLGLVSARELLPMPRPVP